MSQEIIIIAGKNPEMELGGHSSFLRSMARCAVILGYEPHIFCIGPEEAFIRTDYGVIHQAYSSARTFRQIAIPFLGSRLVRLVLEHLRDKKGPHLIHSLNVWGYVGAVVRERLAKQGIEAVHFVNAYTTMEHENLAKIRGLRAVHGPVQWVKVYLEYGWVKWVMAHYERRAFTEADLLLVNYDSVRRLVSEKYSSELKIERITYAPETDFVGPGKSISGERGEAARAIESLRPVEAPLIVSVSRHDPRKGVDVLIRALGKLKARGIGFRACLTSGGTLLPVHRQLANELELGASTILTGWVEDPVPFLEMADIFVLPSLQEGSGSVSMLEAMQAGKCIVASNLDGIPEDLADGENGLLVQPGNEDALADRLERAILDERLRRDLGRGAAETFQSRFSAEAYVAAIGDLYRRRGFIRV